MDLKSANETYDNQSIAVFFLFDHKLKDFFVCSLGPFLVATGWRHVAK